LLLAARSDAMAVLTLQCLRTAMATICRVTRRRLTAGMSFLTPREPVILVRLPMMIRHRMATRAPRMVPSLVQTPERDHATQAASHRMPDCIASNAARRSTAVARTALPAAAQA
jgi:hypothetical protein